MWFGTFTCTCTAPQEMVVGTCHLQGRQPPLWRRSPVSFGQIGLVFSFSGEELRQGSFQPCPAQDGASSMASGSRHDLAHSTRTCTAPQGMVVGTCHLQERQPSTMGKVPCEFWADWPVFSFLGEAKLRQGSFQPCPAQDGASSMASGISGL